jgi:hypothetical protein
MPPKTELIDLFKESHQRLLDSLQFYDRAETLTDIESSFSTLRGELKNYAALEESSLLPVCDAETELSTFAAQAREEITEREDLLRILDSYEVENDHWEESFEQLRALILKHFAAKEQWFFPRLRQLTEDENSNNQRQQADAIWHELAHAGG